MITPAELNGAENEPDREALRLAVLGAMSRAGRPVTSMVRLLAAQVAAAFASKLLAEVVELLIKLGLSPDDVLPPDDATLAEVIELGRQADADNRTTDN